MELITFCNQNKYWNVVQSNPCFEVWLYYHIFDTIPEFEGDYTCSKWKDFVNSSIKGGFDSRRHPILIQKAVEHSKDNFQFTNGEPNQGCTELFKLGESMLTILDEKISKVLKEINE